MQDYLKLHANENEQAAFFILESLGFGVLLIDEKDHRIVYANNAALRMSGHQAVDIINAVCHELVCPAEKDKCPITDLGQSVDNSERKLICADGVQLPIIKTVIPVVLSGRKYLLESFVDNLARKTLEEELTSKNRELTEAMQTIKETQCRMIQQEKLAGIGQLAAGVAHEINNPLAFIISNLGTLDGYAAKIKKSFMLQEREAGELDYIFRDIGELIRETIDGAERVKNIVQDLKGFARISEERRLADINEGLESTLNVLGNELKYKAVVEKEYGNIPMIFCNLGQLNQVFANLIANAADSIDGHGKIKISTWADGKDVFIEIMDSGCGMTPEVMTKIFEPFYTTKDVGLGTGLGLSVSYEIISKHGGKITVESEIGKGSIFTVSLPIVLE